MTWLAFSCSWLRLSPPMGGGFSGGLGFWLGAVGHRVGPAVVMSSRSKSWSLARFSFCKASNSTSGWFQIWTTGNQPCENTSPGDADWIWYKKGVKTQLGNGILKSWVWTNGSLKDCFCNLSWNLHIRSTLRLKIKQMHWFFLSSQHSLHSSLPYSRRRKPSVGWGWANRCSLPLWNGS